MGRSSFFCCFSGGSRRTTEDDWSPRYNRKLRLSDEDRGWWVGERDVDQKATDFITLRRSRFAD